MKKKVVVFLLMICSFWGLFACGSDPYANLSMSIYYNSKEITDGQVINLDIEQTTDSFGEATIEVKVGGVEDTSVTITGGEGYVYTSTHYNKITGTTSITLVPTSTGRTGRFSLKVGTSVGNITKEVAFNIDLTLEGFSFKEDALKAVAKGSSVSLNNIDSYIDFYPKETTQRNLTLEVATLVENVGGAGFVVDGYGDATFSYNDDGHEYAKIEDGVLKTFDTYKDSEGVDRKISYPTWTPSATAGGSNEAEEVIVLKASYYSTKYEDYIVDFLLVPVIEVYKESDVKICMDTVNGGEEEFEITKSESGTFDIVMVDGTDMSVSDKLNNAYCFERELSFKIFDETLDSYFDDFKITTNSTSDDCVIEIQPLNGCETSEDGVIDIYPNPDVANIKILAKKSGVYTHEFVVTHKDSRYAGLFDKIITIKFTVKDLPDDIEITNNGTIINDKTNPQSVTVYDYYKGAKGEKIEVKINNKVGEYKYIVITKPDEFAYTDSLNLYSAKSNEKMTFASLSDGTLSSAEDGKAYTMFGSTDCFYISHSFTTLSVRTAKIYVGVQVSMRADSYVGGEDCFRDIIYLQAITVNFAIGLRSFEFDSNKIYVDLTKSENLSGASNEGTLLYELPEGQTMDSCLNLSKCRYDSSLISLVETDADEENSRVSILIKCNNLRKEGSTTVELVARNGVTGMVTVYTYMPTIYRDSTNRLAVEANKSDSGYLYSVSGASDYNDYASHNSQLVLAVGESELSYDSIHTLFGVISKSVKLSFYDFLDLGGNDFEEYDITSKVKVSFKGVIGYASYDAGVLSFYQLVANYEKPLEMLVTYVGGYAGVGDGGEEEYKEVTVEHTIYIYIYRAMVGVEVETQKETDLYIDDGLGYFDKSLASSVASAKFSPNETELGYVWNDDDKFGGTDGAGKKLLFGYFCSMLDSDIVKDGKKVQFYPNDYLVGDVYTLKYSDLFEIYDVSKKVGTSYTCGITCRLSDDLKTWIYKNYGAGTRTEKIEQFLNNCIYGKDYTLSITISASQFGRRTNATSISYVCKFAPKINSIKLSVNQATLDDDGVYFDVRDFESGVSPVVIDYTIDTTDCLNKKIVFIGGNTAHFNVTTSYTSGTTGKIIITPNVDMRSGGLYDGSSALGIILEDNVSDYNSVTGEYSYFKETLNQFIRIKIADGSQDFPYEIRSTSDYSRMIEDVGDGAYGYYILAKDIDISELSNYTSLDVENLSPIFSLNGAHTYYRNGEKIELYNTIYNLTIKRDVSSMSGDVYIGLFGIINSSAIFSNLRLENVNFELTGEINSISNIYVGGLAGQMRGATLNSVAVSGNISVQITAPNTNLYVGGLVGKDTYNGYSEIINRAKTTSGLSSGEDNVNIGITLSGNARAVYAGGVIGKLDNATMDTLQVVSGISSSMQTENENIGGAIGVSDSGATINNIEVSPVISVSGNNKVGNYGGIIGSLTGGELTYSKAYFVNVGEVDSYLERLNIRVQGLSQANVGGVAGLLGGSASVGYTYARSFYSNDVETNVYAGNIQVIDITTSANVGGVAGLVETTGTISSSYFEGDINVSAELDEGNISTNISAGVLFGKITKGTVQNAYAIGRLYYTLSDGSYTPSTTYGYSNGIVGGATYEEKSITVGAFTGISYPLVHEFSSNATFTNVYAVVNKGPVFVAFDSIAIMGENALDLVTKIKAIEVTIPIIGSTYPFATLSTPLDVFEQLGYKITDGEDANDDVTKYQWFKNEKIYKIDGYYYPILLTKNGKAMYDLVPTEIGVNFNNSVNNIYDISYTETDEKNNQIKHNQLIMFMKKKADGTYSGDYYEILSKNVSGSENVAIQVVFNGEAIKTALVTIPFNDKIEINVASTSLSGVIELKGNRIYPLKEGVAVIEIRSSLDKTVKTTFSIKVIAYLDTIELKKHTNDSVETVEYFNDSSRTVYVDEVSNFEIVTSSSGGYVSTKDIGYILELQDSEKVNGSIKIGETKYSYDEGGNNVFMLSGDSVLSVVGETKGYVKLKLTPYIKLGTTKYVDNSYTGVSTSENIFILNKSGMNVSRTYEIKVLTRAIATSTSMPEISISYNGGVSFNASIETSNVVLVKGGENEENYTILEDVLFSVTKSSESIGFDEERKTYTFVDLEGISDYGDVLGRKYYFATPYQFEHKLIILKISAFTIEKTTINPENKEHTYRITLDMTISFNTDFYRLNASSGEYDLNSISFRTDVVPESNLNYANGNPYEIISESIVGQTTIAITPIGLTDIFMNYYSRGEGLLENTENTYPNDNESFRIVPGRDGLLKITLNEEFSNSSYVTVTLNNKYGSYVRIEQMAGVLESVGEGEDSASQFNTYEELRYNEPFNGDEYYGIKLQKLSCNLATQTYFDGTYYVKVTLLDGVNYDSIFGVDGKVEIVVTSYTIDNFGRVSETLPEPKVKELTITPLPSLSVQVDGSKNIFMGVGTKKALTINYSHLSNNLGYSVAPVDDDNVYIIDDAGERVNTLSLEYIDAGRTYYIAMDVSTDKGNIFTLEVFAQEYIEGILETTRSQIVITAVEYEVKDVSLEYSTYDETSKETTLSILHGESKILKLNISYADIVIGEESAIEEYKNRLDTYFKKGDSIDKFSPKQKVEYSLAGTSVTIDHGNYIEENYIANSLVLYKLYYVSGQKYFEQITEAGLVGGIEILNDSYSAILDDGSIISVTYTLIRGMSISSDTNLRISVPYYYSANGEVCAGVPETGTYFDKYIEFKVVINENSTEDHPTPIENQADLEKYAGLTGHYILLNNIELAGWKPIPATFDSLDGNGYRIIIKSFNMSSVRSDDTVNAGIFTEISETTLIKNLTIDVGYLLVDALTMNNDIRVIQNSKASTYVHDQAGKIDLTFVKTLNFGILAGTNNGSLTNIKVINSVVDTGASDVDNEASKYLHILTSLIDEDENATTSNIGGIVGINSSTGAISNSFVGVNISEQSESHYYITTVINPNTIEYNNEKDEMESLEIYPFVISGSNKLAGIALENSGIISNTYIKGLGLYNDSRNGDRVTAGLVGINSNKITSSFAEGAQIENYRDTGANAITIQARGNVAGLVYTNSGNVENSYANVYLQTNSSSIAGFVFTNSGTINSSYSTSINGNNWAYGPFTGVVNGVAQNTGTYSNCFYLVGEDEEYKDFEVATPMYAEYFTESESMSLEDFWTGFSFVSAPEQNTDDGIWTIVDGLPTIATTQIDTNSFRALTDATEERDEEGIIKYSLYSYVYGSAYQEGSIGNPLIIGSADNFAPRIIAKSNNLGTNLSPDMVFGGSGVNDLIGQLSAVEYVRLVNNLDFTNIMVSNPSDGYSLYEVTFAGKLDGNGMSMNNLKISTEKSQLENFGLFKQIGTTKTTAQSVIKNLDINLIGFTSSNNNKVGVLAGTIINASIANLNINGNSQIISAVNMAGGLAGLIYAYGDNSVSIVDVEVSNISVQASHVSIGGTIEDIDNSKSLDLSYGRYQTFRIINTNTSKEDQGTFTHLKTATNNGVLSISNTSEISYAGAVAGAVIANNCDELSELSDAERLDENSYRSTTTPSIYNILVKGNITVGGADYAGGLFGYLGENSRIKNSKFELSDGQTIVGRNYAGGIVAENHGIIEQCFVAYANDVQSTYDQTISAVGKDRTNGMASLFNYDTTHTVAIGGIAGYSSNGAIVDSFSKVNVVDENAFVAGGLLGYSYRYNYIGYSYTTGAVYARDVMGGVVGLQISENDNITEKLYFDTVVGLNNWANNKEEISSILYSGYKNLYLDPVTSKYYSFYLKMPEIGNQELYLPIDLIEYYNIDTTAVRNSLLDGVTLEEGQTENSYLAEKLDAELNGVSIEVSDYINSLTGSDDEILEGKLKAYYYVNNITSINETYKSAKKVLENKKFVGSVVGASYIFENSEYDESSDENAIILSNASDKMGELYNSNTIKHTFSNTYGMYQNQSGSLENGNKNDTYFSGTFSFNVGTSSVSTYSYRVSYVSMAEEGEEYYNDYAKDDETSPSDIRFNFSNTSKYMDKLNFAQVFTSQEYTEQLIGTFYQTEASGVMKSSYNVFMGYDKKRYDIPSTENGTFVSRDGTQSIWSVKDAGDDYLPFINDGSIVAVEHLYAGNSEDVETLKSIFISNAGNTTYYLHTGIKSGMTGDADATAFEIDIEDFTSINFTSTLRSVFVGQNKPQIVFNIKSNTISTVFNSINGAVFKDIDFVVNVLSSNLTNSDKEFDGFGVLANSVKNSLFERCDFIINYSYAVQDATFGVNDESKTYNAQNTGVFFGLISNSTIKDGEVKYTGLSSVNLNHSNIQNFGLFAGLAYYSTISNMTFNFGDNTAINVNNVASGAKIGLIGYLQGSNYLYNDVKDEKCIQINQINTNSIYVSPSIGYAYNSVVDLKGVTNFARMIYNTSASVSSAYIGAVAGGSQGSRFKDIKLLLSADNDEILTQGDGVIGEMAVGAIVGVDSSSIFGLSSGTSLVGNNTKVNVASKVKTLYVGGLVGKTTGQTQMYNVYNTGEINVTNNYVGVNDTVNTYLGGMIGGATGSFTMSSILSSGDVIINGVKGINENTCFALGGVVGYMSYSCTISNFTVLADIVAKEESESGKFAEKVGSSYASQVVGLNSGSFSASSGYTYSEFVDIPSEFTTSAITNNRISSASNVFYAREFAGNNYTSDSKFASYAYADIYSEINSNSELYVLVRNNVLTGTLKVVLNGNNNLCNVDLLVAETLKDVEITKNSNAASVSAGYSRFYLYEVNNNPENGYSDANYVAITTDVVINHIDTLASGRHISGKTTVDGKVVVTLGYSYNATDYGNLVGTNNGVVSNIYLRSSKENNGTVYPLNVSLVGTNNGLITAVYVYERTQSQFGIANVNNGTICGSATATILYETTKTDIYGLVNENYGLIADCYSSSVGYWENATKTGQVYMVNKNGGTIINSFYYIPEVISHFNTQVSMYKEAVQNRQCVVSNCFSNQYPQGLLNRSTIWTTENDHLQLIGIKDIENAMVVHLYYGIAMGSQMEIPSVETVKNTMGANPSQKYIFTWKIHFYEDESDVPSYNVITIFSGTTLTNYIESLENAVIPNETIVAVFGTVSVSSILEFSLREHAMFIGVYESQEDSVSIEFKSKLNHALISRNAGIIANIKFEGLTIDYALHDSPFAPISINTGIINNLVFNKLTVTALGVECVSGVLGLNTGFMYHVTLSNINLNSNYYIVDFIHNNRGSAGSCSLSGTFNNNNRWHYNGNGAYNG